ncbi:hypothetical protein SOPP22_00475 [Shewanella sp. OPT22]|nr:hypothetical protein SOPP22_00475 [Shewanella sp. OPT22]
MIGVNRMISAGSKVEPDFQLRSSSKYAQAKVKGQPSSVPLGENDYLVTSKLTSEQRAVFFPQAIKTRNHFNRRGCRQFSSMPAASKRQMRDSSIEQRHWLNNKCPSQFEASNTKTTQEPSAESDNVIAELDKAILDLSNITLNGLSSLDLATDSHRSFHKPANLTKTKKHKRFDDSKLSLEQKQMLSALSLRDKKQHFRLALEQGRFYTAEYLASLDNFRLTANELTGISVEFIDIKFLVEAVKSKNTNFVWMLFNINHDKGLPIQDLVNVIVRKKSLLNRACRYGLSEIAELLLEAGAKFDISAENSDMASAIESSDIRTVALLLNRGLKIPEEIRGNTGYIKLALEQGVPECIAMFIYHGCQFPLEIEGKAIFDFALEQEDMKLLKVIVGRKIRAPKHFNFVPYTEPLIEQQNWEVIATFVKAGASYKKFVGKAPPVAFACFKGSPELLKVFLEEGLPFRFELENKKNLLRLVVDKGQLKMLKLLCNEYLIHGSIGALKKDLMKEDDTGTTALHAAFEDGDKEMILFLLESFPEECTCLKNSKGKLSIDMVDKNDAPKVQTTVRKWLTQEYQKSHPSRRPTEEHQFFQSAIKELDSLLEELESTRVRLGINLLD